jgi:membrane protease YdiL (CAAX protease family)
VRRKHPVRATGHRWHPQVSQNPTRLRLTRVADSWAWMRPDLLVRIAPFTLAFAVAYWLAGGAPWLGLSAGNLAIQLGFAAIASPLMFVAALVVQARLTHRRGGLNVPSGPGDTLFQAAFYVVNGPVEEAFFRGLVQGGVAAAWSAPAGFVVATAAYVLYHRLGRWTWEDTLATALVGVPLGLAFWLLPGPPSLVGISIAHIAATCGFLGPGPYLLRRLRLI